LHGGPFFPLPEKMGSFRGDPYTSGAPKSYSIVICQRAAAISAAFMTTSILAANIFAKKEVGNLAICVGFHAAAFDF
jgi:hypothetical protein